MHTPVPQARMLATKERVVPSGRERSFGEDQIIVSKTDLQGRITYANDVFIAVSGYEEAELIGAPHSLIRHPDMPRAVFKFLWDTLAQGREIFAYVNNMARNGDNYWVLAHVTPSRDRSGRITGYHSNRRVPERRCVNAIAGIYSALRNTERAHTDRQAGLVASHALLVETLAGTGKSYEEWIWSL